MFFDLAPWKTSAYTFIFLIGVLLITRLPSGGCVPNYGNDYTFNSSSSNLMYAYSAYCPDEKLRSWNCYWCKNENAIPTTVTNTFSDRLTHAFGYAGYNNHQIIFAFRGSQDLINWIYNLRFPKTSPYDGIPGARVHKGFYKTYESIQDEVRKESTFLVKKFPNRPIIVTGHSLGGALAVLCGNDLAMHLNSAVPIYVWTYGAPRVGNLNFANFFDLHVTESWRTVNQRDLVTHLPLQKMGFEHSTREVWFENNTSTFVICSATDGEDPSCSASTDQWAESIEDHLDYLGFQLGNDDC